MKSFFLHWKIGSTYDSHFMQIGRKCQLGVQFVECNQERQKHIYIYIYINTIIYFIFKALSYIKTVSSVESSLVLAFFKFIFFYSIKYNQFYIIIFFIYCERKHFLKLQILPINKSSGLKKFFYIAPKIRGNWLYTYLINN